MTATVTSPAAAATATLACDGERLWASLMSLAELGATPKGGVNRQALTELDRQARDLFIGWCQAEGMSVRIDAIGNIVARREGSEPDLPAVMTGSHIDTQPTGGKFDGCFGVLAGLEVVRTLNQHAITTRAPIDVVAWTNEEGCRFPPCMMGSGVYAGQLGLDDMLSRQDDAGVSVGEALDAIGYRGSDRLDPSAVKAYFEAHIEQGPLLEDTDTTLGVVIGALGQKWFDLTLTGVEAHAGPTPMHLRKDALVGAAEITIAINRMARDAAPHGRGTVGVMQPHPGSRNVIPGQVKMTVDLRHLDPLTLETMATQLAEVVQEVSQRHGLAAELTPTADFPPEAFDDSCIEAVRAGAKAHGLSHMDIVSGAGHDAIFVGRVAPAAMIFVPCKDGISHNESEYAKPEELKAGCDVLLHAMLESAGDGSAAADQGGQA
ncbi:MAG: Zn-dependent hydrolase [Pseudomonadota bacterium]|nr:Zn-dependent hydrolase [Pseudomonadota bacterium]MEE3216532.1 Zn-dependent hydrolase [Pseudomonadota bacterium]